MDVSNKTLAMFLVAAIVVSIAGTVISLNRLGEMGGPMGPTGFATSGSGNVSVEVGQTLSITLDSNNNIDFGQCSPNSTQDTILTSVGTNANNTVLCGGQTTGNIIVRNDGNIIANVTINVSNTGEGDAGGSFLPSVGGDSRIGYIMDNATASAGCLNRFEGSYTWFTSTAQNWLACEKLNYESGEDRIEYEAMIQMPQDALTGQSDFTLTFWAQNSVGA